MKSSRNMVVVVSGGGGGGRRRRRAEKSTRLSCDDVLLLRFVQRKDVSKSFFYHTLNLKGLGSFFDRSRSSGKTTTVRKRPENDRTGGASTSAAALGGNKVLPIAESAQSRNDEDNDGVFIDSERKCRKKTVSSRVKELLKWSATAKVCEFYTHNTHSCVYIMIFKVMCRISDHLTRRSSCVSTYMSLKRKRKNFVVLYM